MALKTIIHQVYGRFGPEWLMSPVIGNSDPVTVVANTSGLDTGIIPARNILLI